MKSAIEIAKETVSHECDNGELCELDPEKRILAEAVVKLTKENEFYKNSYENERQKFQYREKK